MQNGEDLKAEQIFTTMLDKPETREDGLRSLALLDTYRGHFASAQKRFEQCLTILQGQQAPLSTARVHLWLAIVADGQGNLRTERQELDGSLTEFDVLGPKVIFAAWLGRQYLRSGDLDKAEKIESVIAPLADIKNAEKLGYLQLLQGEIALAQGHADKAVELFTLSNSEYNTAFTEEAIARLMRKLEKLTMPSPSLKVSEHPGQIHRLGPQQLWLAAHCKLAAEYLAKGYRAKAKQTLGRLLDLWKDADPNLLLLKQAKTEYAKLQ